MNPMTDTHSMLVRKKPDLNTYYELAKKAIEAQNIPQAQEHSNNGLHHARIENDQNWIERFNSLNYNLTQPEQYLTPSIVKEDLTKVKGIGPSVAQQLRGIGINSIKSLVGASIEQITTIKGIGYKTAQKIQEEAKNLLSKKSLNDFTRSKELIETSTLPQEGSSTIDKPQNPSKKWLNDKYQRPKTNVWIKPSTNLGDTTSKINQIEEDFEETEDNDTDISIINTVEKIEDNLIHNSTMRDQTEIPTGIMQSPIITEFLETEDEVLQAPLPINKVKKPLSDIELQVSSEMMSNDEIDQKKLEILNILESYEYTTIDKIPLLQKVIAGIDILAIKCVSVSDNLVLLFISPIKLINYKKPLIASAQRLKIANKDEEGLLINEKLNSSLKILDRVQQAIFTDLTSEGSFAVYW
jgi:predicted flap endonuclease-1-like 5' DNA nuclease